MPSRDDSAASVGLWTVCVRDMPSNTDDYIGSFRSEARAEEFCERLRRDVEAVGASHIIDVQVCWIRPQIDTEEFRDELLRDLEEMGYEIPR